MKVATPLLFALACAVFPAAASAADSLGLNTHQSTTVGLDVAKGAGVRWVRIDLNWLDVETSQGTYDWVLMDSIVDAATSRGLSVLAVVAYGPAWASSGDTKGDGSNNDVPQSGTYASFITAAATHFQGKITHYELWNEPNLANFWEGTVSDYTSRVLLPGAAALHAACPSCKVVGPGLATVGGQYDVWMDGVLTAAKDQIDIVSGHAYATFDDVESGAGMTSDSFLQKLESHRVITYNGQTLFEGPLAFKEVMDKHGVTAPFWLTETGYEALLGDADPEKKQVAHYRHVLESMLTRSWWTATIFYEAFDEPPAPYHWGIVVHDGVGPSGFTPKPVYSFLQKASGAIFFGGSELACENGLDDDGDGAIDFPDDTTCHAANGATEGPPSAAGGHGGGGGDGGGGASGSGGSGASGEASSAGGNGGASGVGGVSGASHDGGNGGVSAGHAGMPNGGGALGGSSSSAGAGAVTGVMPTDDRSGAASSCGCHTHSPSAPPTVSLSLLALVSAVVRRTRRSAPQRTKK